jgi:hypothetical protein
MFHTLLRTCGHVFRLENKMCTNVNLVTYWNILYLRNFVSRGHRRYWHIDLRVNDEYRSLIRLHNGNFYVDGDLLSNDDVHTYKDSDLKILTSPHGVIVQKSSANTFTVVRTSDLLRNNFVVSVDLLSILGSQTCRSDREEECKWPFRWASCNVTTEIIKRLRDNIKIYLLK